MRPWLPKYPDHAIVAHPIADAQLRNQGIDNDIAVDNDGIFLDVDGIGNVTLTDFQKPTNRMGAVDNLTPHSYNAGDKDMHTKFRRGSLIARALHTATVSVGSPPPVLRELNAFLNTAPTPHEEEWRGRFRGKIGLASLAYTFRLKLCLGFGVLQGYGRGIDFPWQNDENKQCEVTGSYIAKKVDFQLYSEATFLRGTPFVCLGDVTDNKKMIYGTWPLACFSGCGCDGAAGEFALYRFDTHGE